MKRVVVLLTVVALMVVMVAMSVAPAFASPAFLCTNPNTGQSAFVYAYGKHEAKLLGFTECHKL
jgi:hypothetical protein